MSTKILSTELERGQTVVGRSIDLCDVPRKLLSMCGLGCTLYTVDSCPFSRLMETSIDLSTSSYK